MRFSLISVTFFVVILVISNSLFIKASCPHPVPERFLHVKPGNVVAAYFASWDKYGSYKLDQSFDQVAPHITHLIYAFAKPDAQDGTCTLHDPWADIGANFQHRKKVGGHFGHLLAIKKKYPHLKVLLSVGGGGSYSKALSNIAKTNKLATLVDSLDTLLGGFDYDYEHTQTQQAAQHFFDYEGLFDGIDLDWEWSDAVQAAQDSAGYHHLIQLLRSMLDARSKRFNKKFLLTSAIQVNPSILQAVDIKQALTFVDWFNVMAYDYASSQGSSVSLNAPICNPWPKYSIDSSLQDLYALNISPDKIVLGIALYGHGFDNVPEKIGVAFDKTERSKTYRYQAIQDLLDENVNCVKKWHKNGRVPYVYCAGPNNDDGLLITYDDQNSITIKQEFARSQLLKGIVFWRLSGDDNDHSLIRSVLKY